MSRYMIKVMPEKEYITTKPQRGYDPTNPCSYDFSLYFVIVQVAVI